MDVLLELTLIFAFWIIPIPIVEPRGIISYKDIANVGARNKFLVKPIKKLDGKIATIL